VTIERPVYIDACFTANSNQRLDRSVLEMVSEAGFTCVHSNRVNWHNLHEALNLISRYKTWIDENADLVMPIHSAADVRTAHASGKVGILLGFQSLSPMEDRYYLLKLFQEMGIKTMQLTYSTATSVGGGCFEGQDIGLTDFGHEVLEEMNRLGILIDLSHCGRRLTYDVIMKSTQPVAFTHVAPDALRSHPRNKTDDEMRAVGERGGVVGISFEPSFLAAGPAATIDDYLAAVDHAIDQAGEEHVGIGTDFAYSRRPTDAGGYSDRDKGYARLYIPPEYDNQDINPEVPAPEGLRELRSQPADLIRGMERHGWSDKRMRYVLGENWLRLFGEVWGS
jgi:membrane dipeptidase